MGEYLEKTAPYSQTCKRSNGGESSDSTYDKSESELMETGCTAKSCCDGPVQNVRSDTHVALRTHNTYLCLQCLPREASFVVGGLCANAFLGNANKPKSAGQSDFHVHGKYAVSGQPANIYILRS